jgi:hypothetical protein
MCAYSIDYGVAGVGLSMHISLIVVTLADPAQVFNSISEAGILSPYFLWALTSIAVMLYATRRFASAGTPGDTVE